MSTIEYRPHPAESGLRRRGPSVTVRGRTLRAEHVILAGLVLLAAGIRLALLGTQSLWADEALTGYEVTLPFGAMIHTVTTVEVTPPLYFVLVWTWAKLFGTGAIALRSLSALAGIALVPIAYGATRELVSRRAGLVAAALVTVSPFMIWYSQEARAYMLLAALTGAAFWCFARALHTPSTRNLAGWALFGAAALMTHFFAGFALAPEAVVLLWRHRTRATVLAVAAVAAVQLAMAPFAVADTAVSKGTGWIAYVPISHRISTAVIEWGASNLYRRTTFAEGIVAGVAVLLVVGLLLWRGRMGPAPRSGVLVAAIVAASVLLGPLVFGLLGQDYFLSRNLIPAFVPVITVIAAATTAPRAARLGGAFALVLVIGFSAATITVQTHPYLERADWRRVVPALGPVVRPRAILAAGGTTAQPLKLYLPGVSWAEPRQQRVLVWEVDVVGATKHAVLRADPSGGPTSELGLRPARGAALPRLVAPPGARLLGRVRAANWVVARFLLDRPRWVTIASLDRSAPLYFRHTPRALMVLLQRAPS